MCQACGYKEIIAVVLSLACAVLNWIKNDH